jgi:hypothetical protein
MLETRVPEEAPLGSEGGYRRYHIPTRPAPERSAIPPRFRVRVRKHRLVALVLRELLEYRGRLKVALSRPCVYGVFGGPLGGLAPREQLCVGCLRCTVQYPEVVQIQPNPLRERLGDSYLRPQQVDTLLYEARTGRVPVRGAGWRGAFGGEGWDGIWTDMSEIVRPTRDGIHGREFISTQVDLGEKPGFLRFDARGEPSAPLPRVLSLPIPFLFDIPPPMAPPALLGVLSEAARRLETLAILPLPACLRQGLQGPWVVPLVGEADWGEVGQVRWSPRLIELEGWHPERYAELRRRFPESLVTVRVPMDAELSAMLQEGVRVFHLCADYHGTSGGRFAADLLREAHARLVQAGLREEVTLLGSGGVVMAEHVPKAILCGLDAVALDSALWVALQARFQGECRRWGEARVEFPSLEPSWGVQRLLNLAGSWRDQLLEVLGAMGLREVRRLRGELGRAMFQEELEREAFGGIEGYAAPPRLEGA